MFTFTRPCFTDLPRSFSSTITDSRLPGYVVISGKSLSAPSELISKAWMNEFDCFFSSNISIGISSNSLIS